MQHSAAVQNRYVPDAQIENIAEGKESIFNCLFLLFWRSLRRNCVHNVDSWRVLLPVLGKNKRHNKREKYLSPV
jgi:hypothetical protein